ncbi:MAG: MaoC family dehydratase N-terminal domain-containing protein [Parvibaculaceae bacterium]
MPNEKGTSSGIFDRSTLGQKTGIVRVPIERGRIRFFAKTIGETSPIHSDIEVARRAGYPDIVAPLTYPMVIWMEANEALSDRGEKPAFILINSDFRRLLHGSERYDYSGLIFAGDVVDVTTEVMGFETKSSGRMELAHLKTEITHPERGVLVSAHATAIHRL